MFMCGQFILSVSIVMMVSVAHAAAEPSSAIFFKVTPSEPPKYQFVVDFTEVANEAVATETKNEEANPVEKVEAGAEVKVETPKKVEAKEETAAEPKQAESKQKGEDPKTDGQELYFVQEQKPGQMSGQTFKASAEDRKVLPQSVYNWVLNNLGPTKECTKWVGPLCAEDFNFISYEKLKGTKQFVVLQHQFSLKQDRMVYYVLSADGELMQMQLSRDERVVIQPTSSIVN